VKAAKRAAATLALAAGMTLFGALPAQAGEDTAARERPTATAQTGGVVLPQAGWWFDSFHSTWIACSAKGTFLVAIGQAEDWTCIYGGRWELHLYAWWHSETA
jgi:hypothetical protein